MPLKIDETHPISFTDEDRLLDEQFFEYVLEKLDGTGNHHLLNKTNEGQKGFITNRHNERNATLNRKIGATKLTLLFALTGVGIPVAIWGLIKGQQYKKEIKQEQEMYNKDIAAFRETKNIITKSQEKLKRPLLNYQSINHEAIFNSAEKAFGISRQITEELLENGDMVWTTGMRMPHSIDGPAKKEEPWDATRRKNRDVNTGNKDFHVLRNNQEQLKEIEQVFADYKSRRFPSAP